MPDILIRDVAERTLEVLKRRAAQSGRSLQQELAMALERLAAARVTDAAQVARRIRRRLARSGRKFSDSVAAIRADRRR